MGGFKDIATNTKLAREANGAAPRAEVIPPEVFRSQQAEAIRVLGRRVIEDIVEIGQRLIAVRQTFVQDGGWLQWLKDEFHGWGQAQAYNFIHAAELAAGGVTNFVSLPIDVSAFYRLASPNLPEPIRIQIIERAEAGEHITLAMVQEMIDAARGEERSKVREEMDRRALALKQAGERLATAEKKIRNLNDNLAGEIDRVKEAVVKQYAGKVVLTDQELFDRIEAGVAPVRRQIELAEAERDALLPPSIRKERWGVEEIDRWVERANLEVTLAVRRAREAEWEAGIIKPLLEQNWEWRYEDAYRHIMMNGGFPPAPSFEG